MTDTREQELQQAIETAEQELTETQGTIARHEGHLADLNEAATRAKAAVDENEVADPGVIVQLMSDAAKARGTSKAAREELTPTISEARALLPALQAAVASARAALKAHIDERERTTFARDLDAHKGRIRDALTTLATELASLKASAATSARAMNNTRPNILAMLGVLDSIRDVDMAPVRELLTAATPLDLAYRLIGEVRQPQYERHATEAEIIEAALAGKNFLSEILIPRAQATGKAKLDQWFADIEGQLATLAAGVAAHIEQAPSGDTESYADWQYRIAGYKRRRIDRRGKDPLDQFEQSWAMEPTVSALVGKEPTAVSSDATKQYDSLTDLYLRECGLHHRTPSGVLLPGAIDTSMPVAASSQKFQVGAPRFSGNVSL